MKPTERISVAELAELTGYSESKIYRLQKAGVIKRAGGRNGGGFPLAATIQTLLEQSEPAAAPVASDPKQRLDELKVEKQEFDLALQRREFARIEVLEHYAEQLGAVVHSSFEALPGQIKKRIPHLRAPEVNLIRSLLNKTANAISAFDINQQRAA